MEFYIFFTSPPNLSSICFEKTGPYVAQTHLKVSQQRGWLQPLPPSFHRCLLPSPLALPGCVTTLSFHLLLFFHLFFY